MQIKLILTEPIFDILFRRYVWSVSTKETFCCNFVLVMRFTAQIDWTSCDGASTTRSGQERVYKSSDPVDNEHHYPVEFINRLTPSGFRPHELRVKRDSCIILLRNFDAAAGHCNGTRYIVLHTGNHIIEAVIAM